MHLQEVEIITIVLRTLKHAFDANGSSMAPFGKLLHTWENETGIKSPPCHFIFIITLTITQHAFLDLGFQLSLSNRENQYIKKVFPKSLRLSSQALLLPFTFLQCGDFYMSLSFWIPKTTYFISFSFLVCDTSI